MVKATTKKLPRAGSRQLGLNAEVEEATDQLSANQQGISALARGLDVLSAFRLGDEALGNHELAERSGLPKATASRIALTLVQKGFLRYDQRHRVYELGPKSLALGFIGIGNMGIRRFLRPGMKRLAEETGWNVALGIRDENEVMYVESCESDTLVGLRVYVGFRVPTVTSAIGRAILSTLAEDELETYFAELALKKVLPNGFNAKREKQAIARVRTNGYSDSVGDWHPQINSVAVAFRLPDSDQIYGASLGAPNYTLSNDLVHTKAGPMLADFMKQSMTSLGLDWSI